MGSASTTILSWITTEVDQALSLVHEQIGRYTADPANTAAVGSCQEHLHQVSGALRMVGLAGATHFCETIEGGLARINGQQPGAAVKLVAALDHAVLALRDYVDGLERGQSDVPLRLYPMYHELSELQGMQGATEKDLFYPDLGLQAPAHPATQGLRAEELKPFLQAQRALYQRGMLALLRGRGGLPEMRRALDALHQVAARLPEPRALWWVAPGLLEGLAEPADAGWQARAKALCNKIDFQMRDLAAGTPADGEALLRDVLYAVAKCTSATPRVREIRQLYLLDSLFPESPAGALVQFDMDWLQPALADVRSRLEALKSMWLQYVTGEPKSAARFRELVGSFKAKAGELGNPHLVRLLDAIALVATRLPDPYPAQAQYMVIEMASAFLLAENVVENLADPAADIGEQIGIMGGWLLDAAKGKSNGEPPPGLRADLSERIGALQLRAQVAREIAANLQHVEQVLDGFARDPVRRDTLRGLAPYLRQIHGALNVLGFARAAEILPVCETLIDACAQPGHDDGDGHDMDWIAEGLSSVGFFLDPCLQGHEPSDQAVELFFRRYEKAHAPAEARPFDSTVVLPGPQRWEAPAPAAPRPQVGEEMLAVFLEEAADVLAAVEGALALSREQPLDRDALTTIRRGFHTLKGSGRMVGLMDLGEVAWEIEQVMNRWLEQQHPATPALLELIADARAAFAGWVQELRAGGLRGEIDGAAIVTRARELKSEAPQAVAVLEPAPAPAPEPEADVEPLPELLAEPGPPAAPAPEPEEVEIGGVRLARSLFEVYMREAAQHAATLEAQCAAWRRNFGSEAPHEFVRAAHTLASSSRTAGFEQTAALAEALEQWMPHARHTAAADAGMVQVAVANLRAMAEALARREAPQAAPALVRGLHELIAQRPGRGLRSRPAGAKSASSGTTSTRSCCRCSSRRRSSCCRSSAATCAT